MIVGLVKACLKFMLFTKSKQNLIENSSLTQSSFKQTKSMCFLFIHEVYLLIGIEGRERLCRTLLINIKIP
jgi:hypothetical protein